MNIIKMLAGLVLTVPLLTILVWFVRTMTIPFLIEHGILSGILYFVFVIVIGLVLLAIVGVAGVGFDLIKEGKNQ